MSVEKTDASTNTKTSELSQNDLDVVVGGVAEDKLQSQKQQHNSDSETDAYGYKSVGKKIQQELKDAGLW